MLAKRNPKKCRCFVCDVQCDDTLSLNSHLRIEHDYDIKYGKLNLKEKPGQCLRCDHCNQTFAVTSKVALIKHLSEVHFPSTSNFECHICVRAFESSGSFLSHMKNHTRTFTCKTCSKTFKNRYTLKNHIKSVHKKIFKCEKCSKHFYTKRYLNQHVVNKICENAKKPKLKNLKLLEALKTSGRLITLDKKCKIKGSNVSYHYNCTVILISHNTNAMWFYLIRWRIFLQFLRLQMQQAEHNQHTLQSGKTRH